MPHLQQAMPVSKPIDLDENDYVDHFKHHRDQSRGQAANRQNQMIQDKMRLKLQLQNLKQHKKEENSTHGNIKAPAYFEKVNKVPGGADITQRSAT